LAAGVEDLVYVDDILRVGLYDEVHEGYLQLEQLAHFQVFALLLNNFVRVLLKQSKNIFAPFLGFLVVFLCTLLGIRTCCSKFGQFFHETYKNGVYVNIDVQV